MSDISDEVFSNENRQRNDWESRYTAKEDGTAPKCRIRMEAVYLIVQSNDVIEAQNGRCCREAGQKAEGLLKIPEAWGLPFFVISN